MQLVENEVYFGGSERCAGIWSVIFAVTAEKSNICVLRARRAQAHFHGLSPRAQLCASWGLCLHGYRQSTGLLIGLS